MTHQDCSVNYLFNLSLILAHTIWYEKKQDAKEKQIDHMQMGGDPPAPTPSETTAQQLQAFTQYLPDLFSTLRPEQATQEQFNVDLQSQIQPQLNQLNLDLLSQYGPQYNQLGAELAKQNQESQVANDLSILQGQGKDVVGALTEAQKIADPEYYALREAANKKYTDLLDTYNPSGLSATDAAEIERLTNRSNSGAGVAGLGSPDTAIKNAFAFGSKAQENKNNLANVLNQYGNFQQGNKSGIDAFQVTTGKPSVGAYNQNQFQGVQGFGSGSNSVSDTANNFLNQINQNVMNSANINANRRDSLDRVNETQSAVGSWLSV